MTQTETRFDLVGTPGLERQRMVRRIDRLNAGAR